MTFLLQRFYDFFLFLNLRVFFGKYRKNQHRDLIHWKILHWKHIFGYFFLPNLTLEKLKIKILVITVFFFFKLNFHCNLKLRSKIFYTNIWGAENVCSVIFWSHEHAEKISAKLGVVGKTTLLNLRRITQLVYNICYMTRINQNIFTGIIKSF